MLPAGDAKRSPTQEDSTPAPRKGRHSAAPQSLQLAPRHPERANLPGERGHGKTEAVCVPGREPSHERHTELALPVPKL